MDDNAFDELLDEAWINYLLRKLDQADRDKKKLALKISELERRLHEHERMEASRRV